MRHTTLITLLAAPLALAACDSGQDTAEMEDMPMAEDAMMMDGQDMPMADTGNAMQSASAQGIRKEEATSDASDLPPSCPCEPECAPPRQRGAGPLRD